MVSEKPGLATLFQNVSNIIYISAINKTCSSKFNFFEGVSVSVLAKVSRPSYNSSALTIHATLQVSYVGGNL